MSQPPLDPARPEFTPPPPPSFVPPPAVVPPPSFAPPPQPQQRAAARPRPAGTGRRVIAGLVAAVAATAVVATALLSPGLVQQSSVPAAPNAITTVTPQPQSSDASKLTSGGDIGRPIAFRTSWGSGRVTVTSVTWAEGGAMRPVEGQRYLIAELRVQCDHGSVAVGPLSFVVSQDPAVEASYGAQPGEQLAAVVISAGHEVTGRITFSVAPQATTIALINEQSVPIARVSIPQP